MSRNEISSAAPLPVNIFGKIFCTAEVKGMRFYYGMAYMYHPVGLLFLIFIRH